MLTEDEHIKLVEIGNEYWDKFSRLIAETLEKMPKHLEREVLEYLEDRSSVHGSNFEKYQK